MKLLNKTKKYYYKNHLFFKGLEEFIMTLILDNMKIFEDIKVFLFILN